MWRSYSPDRVATILAVWAISGCVLAFETPLIPLNWTTSYPCAVIAPPPSHIFTGETITSLPLTNTPETCIKACQAGNYPYAGVTLREECLCGSELASFPIQTAPVEECFLPCPGNPQLSCGGVERTQIYNAIMPAMGGWGLQGCFVDTPSAPAFETPRTEHTFVDNLDLVGQCISFCTEAGMPWAGVEDTKYCKCSLPGFAEGAQSVDIDQCDGLCPLPPGLGNETCGAYERMLVYKFEL